LQNEREYSAYNYEVASISMLLDVFNKFEAECVQSLEAGLPIPAYDYVLKCSHIFNLLDARGAISATERQAYILRVRKLAKRCCEGYLASTNEGRPISESAAPLDGQALPVYERQKGGDA